MQPQCTMRLLTTELRENVPVISNVTSRKPCRCLAFGAFTSNGPRDNLVYISSVDEDKFNCIGSRIDVRPRGSHVLELPPTHARTTHSPCTPHPRRSTKASIGILAPTYCPMRAVLISVTKPNHAVSSKQILTEQQYMASSFGKC